MIDFGTRVAFAVLNLALAVLWLVRGSWGAFAISTLAGVAFVVLAVIEWRKNHGRHRQAEAGPQDPHQGATGSAYTISVNTGTATGAAADRPGVELEVVESEHPILAQRAARLLFNGNSKHWGSLNGGIGSSGVTFGADAVAQCNSLYRQFFSTGTSGHHTAPALDCHCGFYAVPCDIEPWTEGANYVTLLVELSGTVIEHEKGYRAGHQRVMECRIPPCRFCGAVADMVDVRDGAMVSACCSAHVPSAAPDQVLVGLDDLAALLPVPVTSAGRRREDA